MSYHGELSHFQAEDEHRVRILELRERFARRIGDVDEEVVLIVADIQKDLQARQVYLESLYEQGIISGAEYAQAVNDDTRLAIRRCRPVLGEEGCLAFFGLRTLEEVSVVDPENMLSLSVVAFDTRRWVDGLLRKYKAEPAQRRDVVAIYDATGTDVVDPLAAFWVTGGADPFRRCVDGAHTAYLEGRLHECVDSLRSAFAIVGAQSVVPDANLYWVSHAFDLGGRAFTALNAPANAVAHFEASLRTKMHLRSWLPHVASLATEVGLGTAEIAYSPVNAATRLSNTSNLLLEQVKHRAEVSSYSRAFLDSRVSLAEACFAAGDIEFAALEAESLFDVARSRKEYLVGVRSSYLLVLTHRWHVGECRAAILGMFKDAPGLALHPVVSRVMRRIDELNVLREGRPK